jgi:hypothetical protein
MVAERTDVALEYQVLAQSTSFGIDPEGAIILKKGYGTQGPEDWRQWFEQLASSTRP